MAEMYDTGKLFFNLYYVAPIIVARFAKPKRRARVQIWVLCVCIFKYEQFYVEFYFRTA